MFMRHGDTGPFSTAHSEAVGHSRANEAYSMVLLTAEFKLTRTVCQMPSWSLWYEEEIHRSCLAGT